MPDAAFNLPEDLTGLTDEELAALREQATAQFDDIYGAEGGPAATDVARATELADSIEKLNAEGDRRGQVVEAAQATLTELRNRVHGDGPEVADPDADAGATDDADAAQQQEPALVADARPPARTAPRELGGLNNGVRGNLNVSLRKAQGAAPDPRVPSRSTDMVITAASATSGAPIGHQFTDIESLSGFMHQQARSLSITNGSPSYTPLATIQQRYDKSVGENTDPSTVDRLLKGLTSSDVLVAAGGWCAPSEIRYNFFDVSCQARTGLIDLPTIGIERGGVRWPTSPTLADVFTTPGAFAPFGATFSNASMPWLWTEADDIAAVTGTGTKPCIRIPCASFNEARLECFGYCLTAGNLADSAFPEATAHFLSLLMAAQIRVENFRYIAQMVSLSTLATPASGIGAASAGAVAPLLGAIELAAIDYRARYGMCVDDVLEVVLPDWVEGVIRSDLAKRTGQDLDSLAVTDQMIASWFDSRGIRVQQVGEYQLRTAGYPGTATPMLSWPSTVEFMIYSAGTFVRGDGMTLDLGVVRDSILNAKNDHTAAWTEECHLIAKFGTESRRYIVNICPDGSTGAADLTACAL